MSGKWNPEAEYAKKRIKGKKGSKKPNCSFSKPWMKTNNQNPAKRAKVADNHAIYKESGSFYIDDNYKKKMSAACKKSKKNLPKEKRNAWKARMDEAQAIKRYGKDYKKTMFFSEAPEEFW